MNENESYVFNVEMPTQWSMRPDHFWISGWFVSKNGISYTDVRAFIDDVPFTGILGLPRADIDATFQQWTRGRNPGFSFRLEPWPGAKLIRLEILNENNDWAEFWRVPIQVRGKGEQRRRRALTLRPELLDLLFLRLLKHHSLHPGVSRPVQARRLVQEYSTVAVETLPVPPFYGQFENPQLIAHTQYDKLHIRGWIFHEQLKVRRVLATTDSISYNLLTYGLPREDVPRKFPQSPHSAHPQFKGIIDLRRTAADPVPLKIFAELENGEMHLVFTRRLYQWSCVEKEFRLPPYHRPHFLQVRGEITQAARELKVDLGGLRFWWAAHRMHRIYREESQDPLPWFAWQKRSPYEAWQAHNQIRPRLLAELIQSSANLLKSGSTEFALIVDAREIERAAIGRLLDSLRAQLYSRWHLVLVTPVPLSNAVKTLLDEGSGGDGRVTSFVGEPDENFAATMNRATAAGAGSWVAFPEFGAQLPREALVLIAEAAATPSVELIFTDEDRITDDGRRGHPSFKCNWSPENIYAGTHPGQLLVIRRDLFVRTGGFQVEYDRTLNFALALRLQAHVAPAAVRHLPQICYHAPGLRPVTTTPTEMAQRVSAVSTSLQRRQLPGAGFQPAFALRQSLPVHQVYWGDGHLARHHVTIVIPTRDHADLLERCIEALLLTVDWTRVKLIIVDDFSREEKPVRFLRCLSARTDFSCRVIRPDVDSSLPFNYSRLVNAALPYVDTPLLLHLNNDVDALRGGWIEEMAGWFSIPEVGAVGARLLYANDHINHAGVIVGPHHGLADVPLAGLGPTQDAPFELHRIARNVSAVTGACMMTRTDLYRELGGFDETKLGVAYNDVDYCLRLAAKGYRTVYTPQAELWHWGSASRGTSYHPEEHIAFVKRYPGLQDPFWSPHLKLSPPFVTIDAGHYAHTGRLGKLHLVIVTHNLNLEGAPLFLLEYVTHLVKTEGFRVEVLTAEDGPLRKNYEELGVGIAVVDRHPVHGARNETEFKEQIQVMLQSVRQQTKLDDVDAFICNTVACWWGVHLAAAAGKPSLFYVHESTTIKRFFSGALHKHMHWVARAAFRQATRVCFLCQSSRNYYIELNDYNNFCDVSSWIDLPRIAGLKQQETRAALRARLGYAEDECVVVNIGTVCERKGQHVFLRTVDHFMRHFGGGRRYRFVLVGGRPGEYQDSLERDIANLGLRNLEIVNETRDVYMYFRAADLFVCTSFEESFPRVLLEAMAFEIPIVSTDVHGIPEMVTHKAEAYLVPPGDAVLFAKTMKTCLDKLQNGTTTVPMGYSKVVRAYDIAQVLPKHADLVREAVLDFDGQLDRTQPARLSGRGDRVESSW
jgi:glycosyltransferase involved in cell wall biosynthesis/GT2 family glycosyltransferase